MLLKFENLNLECVRTMHHLLKVSSFASCFFPRNSTKNTKCAFKLFLIYGCSSAFSSTVRKSSGDLLISGCDIETFTALLILKLLSYYFFFNKTWLYLNTSKCTCSSAVSFSLPSVSHLFPVFLSF